MKKYRKYYVLFVLLYFLVLAAKHIGRSELVYWGGDESRHFMNGVFIKDLLVDGGWRFPSEYVKWYYLKYPALSLHQYPPLFYIIEAVVFSLFGIHVATVQVLIFTIMGLSLYYWYRYVEKKFNPEVALFSLFVLMSAHLFLKNFSQIMLDGISFSLTLLFMYALDFWHTSRKRKHLFLSLALLLILLLIAFKTYFLLFYLGIFVVYQRSSDRPIWIQGVYVIISFLLIFTLFFTFGTVSRMTMIPLLYRTLQGINMMSAYAIKKMILSRNVLGLFHFELIERFGGLVMLLVLAGIGFTAWNKHWRKVSGDVLYAVNFLFIFTFCITHFEPGRFNLFLLPFFALLSGYALDNIIKLFKRRAFHVSFFCVTFVFVWRGLSFSIPYARGYEDVARDLIALNEHHAPVLCDAYLDGNFIAYIRKHDPSKRQIIFRGDKLLFVSNLYYSNISKTYVETEENIYTLLDWYGIRYVVVDGLFLDIPQKALLRKVLQNPKSFRHIKTYQMMTNTQFYKKAGLDVYEYLQYKTDYDQVLTVDMPVMEAGFSFTINELRKPLTSGRNE